MKYFRKLLKNLPALLTALMFSVAVWIFAVTQADPTETQIYPQPLPIEVIGMDSSLTIVNDYADQVTLTLRAPATIINQLTQDPNLIDVTLDLSGVGPGTHTLTPQVNIALSPVELVRMNPASVFIKLDTVVTESFPILIRTVGTPAVGFEAQAPELTQERVTIEGPESLISTIERVVAEVDIEDASEDIQDEVALNVLNVDSMPVEGVILNPETVQVFIPIEQRGGYRTVGVKPVTVGELAEGYRLSNIFALPPTVTVFSSDPDLVEALPSSVETNAINLNGVTESMEVRVFLNLPTGVNVVGSQQVTVNVEVEPIESSQRFTEIPVQIEGLGEGLEVEISPESVDIILLGPVPFLNELDPAEIFIVIDLRGLEPGTYRVTPEVQIENEDVSIESILPPTIEVEIREVEETP